MAQQDIERYEALARQWLQEARVTSNEQDRRRCMVIADGYARLVAILTSRAATSGTSTPAPPSIK